MAKTNLEKNELGAYPCKVCARKHVIVYPIFKNYSGLVYAQCPNCDKFDPYEFIGSTKRGAINNWNDTMVHDYDAYCFKRKPEEGADNEKED